MHRAILAALLFCSLAQARDVLVTREDASSLRYRAAADAGGVHAVVSSADGSTISTLAYDTASGQARYVLLGIDMAAPLTTRDKRRIANWLTSAQAAATRSLLLDLRGELERSSGAEQAALIAGAAQLQLFETTQRVPRDWVDCDTCRSTATGCLGCCGLGCGGCTVCSEWCRRHDVCVRERGHLPCVHLLAPAIASALTCALSDGTAVGCCPRLDPAYSYQ